LGGNRRRRKLPKLWPGADGNYCGSTKGRPKTNIWVPPRSWLEKIVKEQFKTNFDSLNPSRGRERARRRGLTGHKKPSENRWFLRERISWVRSDLLKKKKKTNTQKNRPNLKKKSTRGNTTKISRPPPHVTAKGQKLQGGPRRCGLKKT